MVALQVPRNTRDFISALRDRVFYLLSQPRPSPKRVEMLGVGGAFAITLPPSADLLPSVRALWIVSSHSPPEVLAFAPRSSAEANGCCCRRFWDAKVLEGVKTHGGDVEASAADQL